MRNLFTFLTFDVDWKLREGRKERRTRRDDEKQREVIQHIPLRIQTLSRNNSFPGSPPFPKFRWKWLFAVWGVHRNTKCSVLEISLTKSILKKKVSFLSFRNLFPSFCSISSSSVFHLTHFFLLLSLLFFTYSPFNSWDSSQQIELLNFMLKYIPF